MITKVWKQKGSTWIDWVEWEWKDGYPIKNVSSEARDYAGAHASASPPSAQRQTIDPRSPAPMPNSVDGVKKSVGDLLKGLGK